MHLGLFHLENEMNLDRMIALAQIGELAVQLHQAQNKISAARYRYHEKLRTEGFDKKPDPRAPEDSESHEAVEATKHEYAVLKDSQRVAYNIKRRLQTACRKM